MDRATQVKDPSREKVDMAKQKQGTPMGASLGKAVMPKEKVPMAEVRRSEEGSSMTTKGSKERPCKLDKEEKEKKVLQKLAQGLERMFVKQNECVTTLKEEYNSRILKWRRTLESDEA